MKKIIALIVVCILLVLISIAVNAAPSGAERDADLIKRIFADLHLIVAGLKELIEPLVGLGVAILIAMQAKGLVNQKKAAVARKQATATLQENTSTLASQNDALANIQAAVAPPPPPAEGTKP